MFQGVFLLDNQDYHNESGIAATLYAMVWTLGKEVFEILEIFPKRFVRILSKLHDVLPNESSLMNQVEFLVENLNKIVPKRD